MKTDELRQKFLEFYKKREHAIVPSSSLVPENDPSTLFTGSGMQPLLPYLLGQPHPEGKRLVNSQKSFRAEDIDEIGDNRHTTFFEMLGNWSLGDYFKEEQLPWFFSFLTEEIGLDPKKLYVTVFSGDKTNNIPKDEEAIAIWKRLFKEKGIEASAVDLETEERGYELGMQGGRIFAYGAKKNWWSRSGIPVNMPPGEPGGPDSEIFYDFGGTHDPAFGKECHPNCDCGRFMEIGNSVFMEYQKQEDGSFAKLQQRNVDFGGGLERIAAASNNNPDVFMIDVFQNLFAGIKEQYGWDYATMEESDKRTFRVIADHIRAAVFMIADGVLPSNKERGYILRRLIRRAILKANQVGQEFSELYPLTALVSRAYAQAYPEVFENTSYIESVFAEEEKRFGQTLRNGLKIYEKLGDSVSGEDAFILFTTHGFPIELTEELAKRDKKTIDLPGFEKKMKEHQERSRTASAGKFKGGLADASKETTRLHTAHHLLLAALREVLGDHVHQRGSNITAERLRLDFSHPQKVTPEELQEVEKLVNRKIQDKLSMVRKEMSKEEALKIGAEMEFGVKYGETVSVYFAQDTEGNIFSKEFCGGPHVQNTEELGVFRITKEEAVSSGIRRIRAILK